MHLLRFACINSRVTRFLDSDIFLLSLPIASYNILSRYIFTATNTVNMRFTALSALLGLLAVQQAAAVSISCVLKDSSSNPTDDRPEVTQIGNALPVSLSAQNRPMSAQIRKRVALVVRKIRSQRLALAPAFKEWESKMEITAP